MTEPEVVIDGGLVEDIMGLRIWAHDQYGHEFLILIRYYR